MSRDKVPVVCRVCPGACGLLATLDDHGQIAALEPDREHPITKGYACFKGLQTDWYSGPSRLLHPLKRQDDGSFQRISLEQALAEIAAKMAELIATGSPRAIAGHWGTASARNAVNSPMMTAWLAAIGSPMYFTTMTIDQPAKYVTPMRMGMWDAGKHDVARSDVLLIAGGNPVVSQGVIGFPYINPNAVLKQAKARGMKIVVIDPRKTETTSYADIHLQPIPGEDPSVAAGLLRVILTEGLQDAAFCDAHVEQLEQLRQAVEPFTPDYVERRAGVPADDLVAAAHMFAGGRKGSAYVATGPSMAEHANLSDHLYEALNVVCGRFRREGDPIDNPVVLGPRTPKRAEVVRMPRGWESGTKSRIRDTGTLFGEMMTGILADEILTPGEDQVKALVVVGANPVNAWPDQPKTLRALAALDLLVAVDTHMSATARMAHYVLPPRHLYEIPNIQTPLYSSYEEPFAQYVAPAATPPADSELVDEHYMFWSLAKRLGKTITFQGTELDMAVPPSLDDLLDLLCKDSQVPLAEVRKHPRGARFDVPAQFVEAARPDNGARFDVMPGDVAAELAEVAVTPFNADGSIEEGGTVFTHRLTCRRMRNVMNTGSILPNTRKRHPYNPAHMNPADLEALGISAKAEVEITSPHGCIRTLVEADPKVRRGVVSMSHGWGGGSNTQDDFRDGGSNVNRLVSSDIKVDPITALPRMSAIPVNVRAVGAADDNREDLARGLPSSPIDPVKAIGLGTPKQPDRRPSQPHHPLPARVAGHPIAEVYQ